MVDALLLFLFNVRCLNYSTAQKQVNYRTHPVCVRVWRLMRSNFEQSRPRLCPAFVTHVVTFGPLPFVSLATSNYNVDEWLGIIICILHIVDDHKWFRKVPGCKQSGSEQTEWGCTVWRPYQRQSRWSSSVFLCWIEIVFSRATESHVVDKLAVDFAESLDMNGIENLSHEMKHLFRKTVQPWNVRKKLYRAFYVSVNCHTEEMSGISHWHLKKVSLAAISSHFIRAVHAYYVGTAIGNNNQISWSRASKYEPLILFRRTWRLLTNALAAESCSVLDLWSWLEYVCLSLLSNL